MGNLLFLIDLRLFFLLIHHTLLIVDWLIVLHLIVSVQIVVNLFFSLFGLDVVLVFNVLVANVLGAPFLHFTLVLILFICVAVVLFGGVLIYNLMFLIFALFHVLVVIVHDLGLLGMVHVAMHLTEVLFGSLIAIKVIVNLILICLVLLHLVLTNEILSNCFFVAINLILHF